MSKRTTCGFRFQGHYVYRQIFPSGTYKIMVWVASTLAIGEETIADVAFCGKSHVECMDKLKQWLEINKSWVNKTDGNT
jgi:hypothetical protein